MPRGGAHRTALNFLEAERAAEVYDSAAKKRAKHQDKDSDKVDKEEHQAVEPAALAVEVMDGTIVFEQGEQAKPVFRRGTELPLDPGCVSDDDVIEDEYLFVVLDRTWLFKVRSWKSSDNEE